MSIILWLLILILDYYKNNGYLDINVQTKIEYLQSNKVNIYFEIFEGNLYKISSLKINDRENILDKKYPTSQL